MSLFAEVGVVVEPGSMEEAFLQLVPDAAALPAARGLRRRARDELGLPDEEAYRRALPVDEVWGIGPTSVERLHRAGWRTLADVSAAPLRRVVQVLGTTMGRRIHAVASGTEQNPVRAPGPRRSFSTQSSCHPPVTDEADRGLRLGQLTERLADRLDSAERYGSRLRIWALLADGDEISATGRLAAPTNAPGVLTAAALRLHRGLPDLAGRPVTLLGVSLDDLLPPHSPVPMQLPLP